MPYYEAAGLQAVGTGAATLMYNLWIYGSEFKKGTDGMDGSL
jgi:hypothetical protein